MNLFDYQDYDVETNDSNKNVSSDDATPDAQSDATSDVDTDYVATEDIDISQGLKNLTLDERVRLAERGEKSDLDILVDDPDYRVRELVAHHGYAGHLNQLVLDPHPIVRGEVAGSGKKKYLEQLKKDPDIELRAYVLDMLEK